jgi:hypothetical protein
VLRYGVAALPRLLKLVILPSDESQNENALLDTWMESLQRNGAQKDAHPFLQILTSPELQTG